MLQKFKITTCAFILFLCGFTLITGSTAFAKPKERANSNRELCEGPGQGAASGNFRRKFIRMKRKINCFKNKGLNIINKLEGHPNTAEMESWNECATIKPELEPDNDSKLIKMEDKVLCYKMAISAEAQAAAQAAAEAQAVADAQAAAEAQAVADAQGPEFIECYQIPEPTESGICFRALVISLQAQLDAPPAQATDQVASTPPDTTSNPYCKENEVDSEEWVPREKLESIKKHMEVCMKQSCPGVPIDVSLCPKPGGWASDQFGYRYTFKE